MFTILEKHSIPISLEFSSQKKICISRPQGFNIKPRSDCILQNAPQAMPTILRNKKQFIPRSLKILETLTLNLHIQNMPCAIILLAKLLTSLPRSFSTTFFVFLFLIPILMHLKKSCNCNRAMVDTLITIRSNVNLPLTLTLR